VKTPDAPRTEPDAVSELTTNRLSVYLHCLKDLETAGIRTISSEALARRFHLNAAQIRKDLAHFGEFGVRGVGYSVPELERTLRHILGLDQPIKVGVVGAGNLGLALADYPGFRQDGFDIVALFDRVPSKVGRRSRGGVPICHVRQLKSVVRREGIRVGVVAVPASVAQPVTDLLVRAGVRAILSFSPGTLAAPPGVKLCSVDLSVSLASLSYHLGKKQASADRAQPTVQRKRSRARKTPSSVHTRESPVQALQPGAWESGSPASQAARPSSRPVPRGRGRPHPHG
jgi:redox-sensing transcriptional repressor